MECNRVVCIVAVVIPALALILSTGARVSLTRVEVLVQLSFDFVAWS